MSRLASLVLVLVGLGVACSSTAPGETGPGGHGGASAGAGGDGGGSSCSLPPSDPLFNCAATYDAQAAMATCTNAIETGAASAGQCGSGWAWRCGAHQSRACFYDGQKILVRARWCEDAPTPLCQGCNCPMPNCVDSIDLSTDGPSTCNLNTLPPVG